MEAEYYNSKLEVQLGKIKSNIEKIRNYTGGLEVLPVVKSNAYGLGTVAIARYLVNECNIKFLATARIFEACQILDAGIPVSIMILGPVPYYSVPIAVARNIQIPVFNKEGARLLSEEVKKAGLSSFKVQLKIETGMNRIGVKPGQELAELLAYLKKLGNLQIEGVYTHFATADIAEHGAGNDFTREQFAIFKKGLQQVKEFGITPKYIHCCNTGATTWLKEAYPYCTHVRVGSLYLGYASIQDDWNPIGVEECASWKTTIVNLKVVHLGESVGYGRKFMPVEDRKVATIGIGYGDGYLRHFAMQGAPVLVQGQRCPFVGICMDQAFVDVTNINCKIGDEVTLFGKDGTGHEISGLEIGHLLGETRLAMFTHITERVARVYIK